MRPGTLVLFLTLPAALATASDEPPQATLAPETVIITIEAPPTAPFDFRQGRDWPKYLQGTKPRVLPQPEAKQLNADAGTCYTMKVVPARPDIDPAMAMKASDVDPRMILKTGPACEPNAQVTPPEERKILLRKP